MNVTMNDQQNSTVDNTQSEVNGASIQDGRLAGAYAPHQIVQPTPPHPVVPLQQYQFVSTAQQPGTYLPGVNTNNGVLVSNSNVSHAFLDQNGNIVYSIPTQQFIGQTSTELPIQNNVHPNLALPTSYVQQQSTEVASIQATPHNANIRQVPVVNGSQSLETHDINFLVRKPAPISDQKMTPLNENSRMKAQEPGISSTLSTSQSQSNLKANTPRISSLTEEGEVVRMKKPRMKKRRSFKRSDSQKSTVSGDSNHHRSNSSRRLHRPSLAIGNEADSSENNSSSRTVIAKNTSKSKRDYMETDKYHRSNGSSSHGRSSGANDDKINNPLHQSDHSPNKMPVTDSHVPSITIRESMNPKPENDEDNRRSSLTISENMNPKPENDEDNHRTPLTISENINPKPESDENNSMLSITNNVEYSNPKPENEENRRSSVTTSENTNPKPENDEDNSMLSITNGENMNPKAESDEDNSMLSITNNVEYRKPKPDDNEDNSILSITNGENINPKPENDEDNRRSSITMGENMNPKPENGKSKRRSSIAMGENMNLKPEGERVIDRIRPLDKKPETSDNDELRLLLEAADRGIRKSQSEKYMRKYSDAFFDKTIPLDIEFRSKNLDKSVRFADATDIRGIRKSKSERIIRNRSMGEDHYHPSFAKTDQMTIATPNIPVPLKDNVNSDVTSTNQQPALYNSDKVPQNQQSNNFVNASQKQNVITEGTNSLAIMGGSNNDHNINAGISAGDKNVQIIPNDRQLPIDPNTNLQMDSQIPSIHSLNTEPLDGTRNTHQYSNALNNQQPIGRTQDSRVNYHHEQYILHPDRSNISSSEQPINYSMQSQQPQQNMVTSLVYRPINNVPAVDPSLDSSSANHQPNNIPTTIQDNNTSSLPQRARNRPMNEQANNESSVINEAINDSSNTQILHQPINNRINNPHVPRSDNTQFHPSENNLNPMSISGQDHDRNSQLLQRRNQSNLRPTHIPNDNVQYTSLSTVGTYNDDASENIRGPETAPRNSQLLHRNNQLNLRPTRLQNDNQYTAVSTEDTYDDEIGEDIRGPERAPENQPSQTEGQSFPLNNEESIEAFVANEVVDATTVAVCLGEEEEKIVEENKYIKRGFVIAICIVFVVIATVVPLSLLIFKKSPEVEVTYIELTNVPTHTPTLSPTSMPTFFPTSEKFYDISQEMRDARITNTTKLATPGTPQYRALKWFSQDPTKDERDKESSTYIQRFVLAILYYSLSEESIYGDGWFQCSEGEKCISGESSWLSRDDECEWAMISCDSNGHILEIHAIRENNMFGTLPDEIGLLTTLEVIEIQRNFIYGTIPDSWSQLTNMKSLFFSRNYLTNPFPVDILSKLTKLENLYLDNNDYEGAFPKEIMQMTSLIRLRLNQNNFQGRIPSSVRKLINLEELELSENALTGPLPKSIGYLNYLSKLDVSHNMHTGDIPSEILGMKSLKVLNLSNNTFGGQISTNIQYFGESNNNAKLLRFDSNQFIGNIPSQIGNIKRLRVLNFTNNLLTGKMPNNICESTGSGLMDLKFLEVDCGNIQCTCCSPTCFDNELIEQVSTITSSDDVIFWNNPRTPQNMAMSWYTYDDTFGYKNSDSFSIQRFTLAVFFSASNVGGWISSNSFFSENDECSWEGIVCNGNEVEEINLPRSNLGGFIPKEIGYLSSLRTLDLQDNSFAGSIPGEIGKLKELEVLYVNNNNLEGTLSHRLFDLAKLNEFFINGNSLSGTINSKVGMVGTNSNEMKRFMFQMNEFIGSVPSELGNVPNLEHLGLHMNNFAGLISDDLCDNIKTITIDCMKLSCKCCICKR